MKKQLQKLLIAAALTVTSVQADTILFEDFGVNPGTIPATWGNIATPRPLGGPPALWAGYTTGNYTGGSGGCASVINTGQLFGYSSELVMPTIDLSLYNDALLTFKANYQDRRPGRDYFDVDVNTGSGWTTLQHWDEDHGAFISLPGEDVSIDLTNYIGESNVMVRFRFYNDRIFAAGWYAQIDDVLVSGTPVAVAVPMSNATKTGLYLLLAAGAFYMMRRRIGTKNTSSI